LSDQLPRKTRVVRKSREDKVKGLGHRENKPKRRKGG